MYCNGLFFFPWTDPHGNRWCAFATENTLFIYEQKDRKPKTEQLYIEKQNKTWKWDLNWEKALTLGCCVQSHLVLKMLKNKTKNSMYMQTFSYIFWWQPLISFKMQEFIIKKKCFLVTKPDWHLLIPQSEFLFTNTNWPLIWSERKICNTHEISCLNKA